MTPLILSKRKSSMGRVDRMNRIALSLIDCPTNGFRFSRANFVKGSLTPPGRSPRFPFPGVDRGESEPQHSEASRLGYESSKGWSRGKCCGIKIRRQRCEVACINLAVVVEIA